jgi:uncharacterized protein
MQRVPRRDFAAFLETKFVESKFKVQQAAIDHILELAEEVPYNVQMLANVCWANLRDQSAQKTAALTTQLVDNSLDLLVRQYDPFYTQVWTLLTSIQQKTLLAVIEERGVNLQSTKVIQKLGKGPSTVRRSLGALLEKNILREEEKDGRVRMRFEDPFFAQWVRQFTPSL